MGFERDCRKYSHAAILGWRVLRFTTDMVMSGEGIDLVVACIQGRYIDADQMSIAAKYGTIKV